MRLSGAVMQRRACVSKRSALQRVGFVAQLCRAPRPAGRMPVIRAASDVLSAEGPSTIIPTPIAVVKPKPLWNEPSGQDEYPGLYGTPMAGTPEPLGAHVEASTASVNFAVVSSSARAVSLVLFHEEDLRQGKTSIEIKLDPDSNRTGDVWHILVPDIPEGMLYGFRVSGMHQATDESAPGHRYDDSQVVLDPYATSVISSRRVYGQMGPDLPYEQEGVLGLMRTWPQAASYVPSINTEAFDWEGDVPLNLPMNDLVIYEMHVRGFTQALADGTVSAPGTYAGMVEKLDYLQNLGITAVELLPVQEFNELEYYTEIPGTDQYRYNFWGYSTVGFFAPMSRFSAACARGEDGNAIANEFKTLVKECHKRGIEVILDVVFNHTAEGNELGPTLSFRGLDNRMYYMMAPGGEYYNYSGCGNTFNCNHPQVSQFIVDCLRYWVEEYHVDGFRFDLASILTRAPSAWHSDSLPELPQTLQELEELTLDDSFDGDPVMVVPPASGPMVNEGGFMTDADGTPTGTPLSEPPVIKAISEDPVLMNTKLIAEAWDCDGLLQVGAFPHFGGRWSEWNGRFRDVVRNFIKGSDGGNWAGEFASIICGSPNLYAKHDPDEDDWWGNNGGRLWRGTRGPTASVNFIIAHDGFTLADLVSYNEKHNDANGEDNRDGENHNLSWNCGAEGPTDRWDVKRLRQRQMRNHTAALLVAAGVPMLHMGDEYGQSKNGNNNTYCHDSYLNYLNWQQAEADETGLLRFTKHMISLRKRFAQLRRDEYPDDSVIQWHGTEPFTPDWSEESRLVAFTLSDGEGGIIYAAFNTSHKAMMLNLPPYEGRVWQTLVDTSRLSPYDVLIEDDAISHQEIVNSRAASAMWTSAHVAPVLPWSCLLLESIPEQKAASSLHVNKAL